ncbi:DUF262 domain-containing protein [Persephonella sp.]
MKKIEAEKKELSYMFTDFWYIVPEYQRPYVWNRDNVLELLEDLWFSFTIGETNEYFIGSLVLRKLNESPIKNEYEILDGQQRLTTFLLIFNTFKNKFKGDTLLKDTLSQFLFQKRNQYTNTPERQRIVFKIRGNSNQFLTYLIRNSEIDNNLEEDISIKNMKKAIETIEKFIDEKVEKFGEEKVKNFVAYILNKVVLIYVSTDTFEDAFRLFTILNNRGVPLTNADILKAINIGEIESSESPSIADFYAKKWESMHNYFEENFERFLEYIRTILVKDKANKSLLEEFEEKIYKKRKLAKGRETIDTIERYFNIYKKIIDFTIDEDLSNSYKNLITIMREGISSTEWIPSLLQFYKKFEKEHLFDFLKKLEFKFISDWILGETSTKRRENIYRILKAIDDADTPLAVINNNRIFSVDIDKLKSVLSEDIYGRQYTKYLLLRYEYLKQDNSTLITEYKYISVEHILPQNPKEDSKWKKWLTEEEIEIYKNKIGNLVLLNRRKNSSLSNLDFDKKKERYFKGSLSTFPSINLIMQKDKWQKEDIENRTQEMISLLTQEVQ